MYQLSKNGILKLDDNLWIPRRTDNADWQQYQQWLSEGNKPLPMDPPSIDNTIFITNGQARQQRIQREQQQRAAVELLTLKKQVALFTA